MNVAFDRNSAGATGAMPVQTVDFTGIAKAKLTANKFTNEPFTFAGWTLTPAADPATVECYDADRLAKVYEAYVKSSSVPDDDFTVTLYAVWLNRPDIVINYLPNIPGVGDETSALHQKAFLDAYTILYGAGDIPQGGRPLPTSLRSATFP